MLAGILAAVAPPTARAKLLAIGGLDVSREPGVLGLGSPIESVEVTHAGPGAVSAMVFDVDDPLKTLTIPEGSPILYANLVTNATIFVGWVQVVEPLPAFGTGRRFRVEAVGPEALLDWSVIPSLTLPAGMAWCDAIQTAVAAAEGTGPLRAFASPNGSSQRSSQAKPIEGNLDTLTYAVTLAQVTLREAIRRINAASTSSANLIYATVDMTFGLRAFAHGEPVDYNTLVVADTGPIRPENLTNRTDYGPRIRTVSVVGGNAAGTGIVTDGSGLPGRTGALTDPSILTAAARDAAGANYLTRYEVANRGTYELVDHAQDDTVRPGGRTTIASAQLGLTALSFGLSGVAIGTIVKRFHGSGRETWTVSYGGNPPSLVGSVRRLTRDTLS